MVRGWILDARPDFDQDALEVWLWTTQGTRRVVDRGYHVPFYVAASEERLGDLGRFLDGLPDVASWDTVEARTDLRSPEAYEVLRIFPRHYHEVRPLAEMIDEAGGFHDFRLYNVDLRLNQRYLLDKGLVPSAWAEHHKGWRALEDRYALEYEVPGLDMAVLDLHVANPLGIPRLQDRLLGFHLGEVELEGQDEVELLHALDTAMREVDPDVVLTDGGDSFLLPFLVNKAAALGVDLQLGRAPQRMVLRKGKSYFTYGKIVHKPGQYMLRGRVHLDRGHFSYREAALYGPVELSRLSGIPVQEMSRLTPGTAFSAMQINEVLKQGALVLWKKNLPEDFKTAENLVLGDRGGFYFEPEVGIHEGIAEVDFSSLYPSIMVSRNLSYETMRCSCCVGEGRPVPGLDNYYSCIRRKGIVPIAIEPLIERRRYYKKRKTGEEDDPHTQRDSILKWTLVTCLDGGTVVPYRLDGVYRIGRIDEVIDRYLDDRGGVVSPPDGLYVFGPNKELNLVEKRVAWVIKALAPEKLLRIRLQGGREVLVTPNHRFLILTSTGSLVEGRADELGVGDFIPEYASWPFEGHQEEAINVLQPLYSSLLEGELPYWRIKGAEVTAAVAGNLSGILSKALAQGYTSASVRVWHRGGPVPLQFLPDLGLTREQLKAVQVGRGRKKGGHVSFIPTEIPLDPDLAFLLGFYAGDGSVSGNMLRFAIGMGEPEIIGKLMNCAYEKFGLVGSFSKENHANMYSLQLNSSSLPRVLKAAFEMGPTSERGKLVVPSLILNGSEEVRYAFLSGLLASDGSVHPGRDWYLIHSYKRGFVEAISLLLMSLGVRCNLRTDKEGRYSLYRIEFHRHDVDGKLWLKDSHRERIALGPKPRRGHRAGVSVVASGLLELCAKFKLLHGLPQGNGHRISNEELIWRLGEIEKRNGGRLPEVGRNLLRLALADLSFRSIKEVSNVSSRTKHVYCFETEDDIHGFILSGGTVSLNSFGYQGFKNHRFGRIECHESINAYARDILLRSMEIAEGHGYEVVHGIVDSLWLRPTDRSDAIEATMAHIADAAGVQLDLEGWYKWIVFLPCKTTGVGALNRYYGLFQDGEMKLRGIEVRKHDTPPFINQLQEAILGILSEASDAAGFRARIPRVLGLLRATLWKLHRDEIPPGDAVITKAITKPLEEYLVLTNSVAALRQMKDRGFTVEPGEYIRYIITKGASRDYHLKVRVAEFIDGSEHLDHDAYSRLACRSVETLLSPLGYTEERLVAECSPLGPVVRTTGTAAAGATRPP